MYTLLALWTTFRWRSSLRNLRTLYVWEMLYTTQWIHALDFETIFSWQWNNCQRPRIHRRLWIKSYCRKHKRKKLKLYCETCEEIICSYCMAFEHVRPDHVCSALEDIAGKKRAEMKSTYTAQKRKENGNKDYYDKLSYSSIDTEKSWEEWRKIQFRAGIEFWNW